MVHPLTASDAAGAGSATASAAARGSGLPGSLRLHNLRKDYGTTAAVDGISLDIPPGSFLVLLGPSGCGKTTTLRMLAGLDTPTGGEIYFGDTLIANGSRALPPAKREVGLVFQSYALWPHKTVFENIAWPLKVAKWQRSTISARVHEVLELLDIAHLAQRYPGECSGGQQQRVAIGRMIAPKPRYLLFDEPLSNLDAKLRVDTRAELMRLHRETGATSVYVTHDQVEAMTMATHVALMRDGHIEQLGTPAQLLSQPRTAFTATFIGTPPANILPATVDAGRIEVLGTIAHSAADAPAVLADGPVQVMYRSTSVSLGPQPPADNRAAASIVGRFIDQVPMADRWVIGVDLPGSGAQRHRVSVTCATAQSLFPGDEVELWLPACPDALFDSHGQALQ